ncbi:MAG: DivIVA domain-containing protein [Candidatus Cyclobacteriaceae bacterium M2_1C_046]
MKITPLEIRQKTFEKKIRGYDKDEVNGYLQVLSQEWEKLMDENKELSIKLKSSEREVEKLREVENSLFKTLKTAEDTGANIMDQASKAAELHMRETEFKAEALLNDARNKAHNIIENAEVQSKNTYEEVEDQLKALSKLYRTLENLRDDLLSDIKSVTVEINQKVDRATSKVKHFDVDQQLMEIRKYSAKSESRKKEDKKQEEPTVKEEPKENKPKAETEAPSPKPEKPEVKEQGSASKNNTENKPKKEQGTEEKQNDEDKSFFDEIE